MIGDIVVLTPDDYKKWLAESTSGMSLAQNGERLFASLSCNACHNGSRMRAARAWPTSTDQSWLCQAAGLCWQMTPTCANRS